VKYMEKGKFKWETPELVKLSQIVTRGFCISGSGDADMCLAGVAAAGGCNAGTGGAAVPCAFGSGV
jgi:hypothetical protein